MSTVPPLPGLDPDRWGRVHVEADKRAPFDSISPEVAPVWRIEIATILLIAIGLIAFAKLH